MRPLPIRAADDSIGSPSARPIPGPIEGVLGMPKQVVLVGHPVSHSLSGELQQAAFDDAGGDARYEPLDVALMNLPETVDQLRGDDYLGANITVPYKERVVSMMDR